MEEPDRDPIRTEQRVTHGARAAEGERFECSARSCAAATIADCVALCCCPCAVVSLVAFALVKVPWAIGRRCLAAGKMRRKTSKRKKKAARESEGCRENGVVSKKGWWTEEGIVGISSEEELEKERVWWESYQVGHLGFGRVSFTGVQILKPN